MNTTIDDNYNKSIAVIDDEEDIVILFIEVLQDNGYLVMGFTNPLFIQDYVWEYPNRFSLIIVDYKMSPMQWCELASKIANINPKIKMVLITTYDDIKK